MGAAVREKHFDPLSFLGVGNRLQPPDISRREKPGRAEPSRLIPAERGGRGAQPYFQTY